MKYSKHGYKRNSKDKNNLYNVIPSGNITMKNVDFPVFGMDNLGNSRVMMPGGEYIFPGNTVFETPLQNFPRHFQQGGSLPKAQFGWNDFEKSKIGKFVDAKGLRRDGEHMMNTIGDYFGYENTAEDARRMGLDASAMVNPLPDFINAYDHAQQGKHTDAALYAMFGILPFSAGPLVKGTKKAFNYLKNTNPLGKNAKIAKELSETLDAATLRNTTSKVDEKIIPVESKKYLEGKGIKLSTKQIKESLDNEAFVNQANKFKSKIPLTRALSSKGLKIQDGKLYSKTEPHKYERSRRGDRDGYTLNRNTTHWSYGHIGDPNHGGGSWGGRSTAIVNDFDNLKESGLALNFDPTDTYFYTKGDFEIPSNSLILTRDKKLYNRIKKETGITNIKLFENITDDAFGNIVNSYSTKGGKGMHGKATEEMINPIDRYKEYGSNSEGNVVFRDRIIKDYEAGKDVAINHKANSDTYYTPFWQGHDFKFTNPLTGQRSGITPMHPDYDFSYKTLRDIYGGGHSRAHGASSLSAFESFDGIPWEGNHGVSTFDKYGTSTLDDLFRYPKTIQVNEIDKALRTMKNKPEALKISKEMAEMNGFKSYKEFKESVDMTNFKKYGGSLPKAQKGITEFEVDENNYIQTEAGYDKDALFNFAKNNYLKKNTASQKSDLVTKLNSPAFRERYRKNIFNISGKNLSEEELTNRINQQSDFTEAGPDFHVTMPYITTSHAGYRNNSTPYISPFAGKDIDGNRVGLQGVLDFRRNQGLYQQKNTTGKDGTLYGRDYYDKVTNPDFPELAKYPYIPQLSFMRDAYTMGDNQIRSYDNQGNTIVHEYAHSYNTDDSALFNPEGEDYAALDDNKYDADGNRISKGSFIELPGEKYKGWLSNLFGEDYFDKDKNKYGAWAMHPWEISSIKSETEGQLKDNNIWDHTKGEFGEANLDNMLKHNSRLDIGGHGMDPLNRMGYSSLQRMVYNQKRNTRKQDDANWSIDNNPNDYILDNIINAEDNASMDMDAFNTIFNNSQSNLKDKQKYTDYNSLLKDYKGGNKRKKKRATEIINTINKGVKDKINQGYNTENENYQIEYNKKKGEVLPKLKQYFNEIAMEDVDQPTMAKYGGSLPKAQYGFGPLGSLYNYGLDKVKNKIADNLNPYSYHDPFQRLYDAIFTTENKTDANFKHKDEKIERRDLLHMLMGLDQENNSILQQNQYNPTKGHNEGDTYYSSPFTEAEIKHQLSKVGKTRKENFFLDKNYQRDEDRKWTDEQLEKFWISQQNQYLDGDIYDRLIYGENNDDFNDTYNGKEIARHKTYVEEDPDKYVHFTDTPQYDEFLKSDGYDAWANNKNIERENEIDYPDAESLMTTKAGDEGVQGGFYGGVLGNFILNQEEDEQGKYFSYYDKWDLDPFKGDGDWKETLSEFGQKHILGVSPTQIYNRMYYTIDDQGNYVFKDGGSLPKVQKGGEPSTIVPLQKEGKSEEIDAFGYKGYFDFNQEPINMDDNEGGHKGYLFVYTEGPSTGGSYWRPLENKYSGSRWEKSGQVEEYNAYFTNPNLIDEHWDKGSAVALKIKEAVKNNILYSELPEYLKDVNTWRTISPNRDLEKELKELDKKQTGDEISVSFDDLEKGIRHVESINGTLMKNKQSSASGYYGDLFDNITYDGTRDEFIADIDFQKKRFKQRYNGEIKDVPGLKSNGIDIYNEYKNQVDFTYTPTEIAALSNLLGRQGTRKYFGNVLRDGETLESVFPNLYGDERQLGADGKPLENKTPEQYIEKFKNAINKKTGGEFIKKVKRLNQQLKKYNQGGVISPLAYQELVNLKMIKPKMQDGGSFQKEPYITQRGDTLGKIASDNLLNLSELLEYNPKYKNNPNDIGIGETIQLSDTPVQNNNTPNIVIEIKSGDTLSQIASKYGVRYQDIATLNNISDPRLIQPGQKIKLPDNASINKNNKNIKEQKKQAESVYVPEVSEINLNTNTVINEPWAKRVKDKQTGEWITIGKREKINSINKMNQADRIINGMNDIEDGNNEKINYTIQKGDMLGVLANTNGISVKKLMEDNNISDARKIQAGQKIVINKPKGKPYIVVDEKAGRMHLYYPGNSEPSDSYPILSGVNPGDQQTKTVETFFKDGEKIDGKQLQKIMDENNFTEAGQVTSLPGYTSSVDWDAGNKSTGAGVYTIGTVNPNSGYIDESGQGRKSPSFVLLNAAGNAPGTVIHSTPSWNTKYKERRDALKTGQTSGDDGRFTSGCINGTCSAMIDLFENPDVGEGTQVFVLPEDKGNNFVYENGKINFYTSYDNDQKSKTYFTKDGDEKKNPLGLNETPSNKSGNYKPINIEFDKTFFQSNSKRFDGDVKGEEEEFTNNTKPYIESLADNKKNMMDKLGIDGDTYNDLAMIAFGIYGYESGMGDVNNPVENFSKFATKGAGAVTDKFTGVINNLHSNEAFKIPKIGSLTSPDVESKFNTYGIDDLDSSVGWTQLRWKSLDSIEKKNLSKLNINEDNYQEYAMDPAKSAELTIARLYGMHQKTLSAVSQRNKKRNTNSLSDRDIKKYGADKETYDAFNYLPEQWSPTSPGYTDFVNGYTKYITVTETDINDVDNGLIVKGEYSEDNPQFRERIRNRPAREKIINADETLKYMAKDAKDIVNEKINQVSNWWDQVDLNPFYKLGGEFGINNQVQFYNDYINGLYKNTKQEKKANKMYDKLNRLYYNDSKQNNMHQLDIMKSIQSKG